MMALTSVAYSGWSLVALSCVKIAYFINEDIMSNESIIRIFRNIAEVKKDLICQSMKLRSWDETRGDAELLFQASLTGGARFMIPSFLFFSPPRS